jgi:tetratricopeptide (TPR) repeat protein
VLLLPVLGLAQSGPQLVADRYSYLPSIPMALLLAAGLGRLARTLDDRSALSVPMIRQWHVLAAFATMAAVLVALSLASGRQIGVWHNSLTLWSRAIELEPDNYFARNQRASALMDAGQPAAARDDLDIAVAVNPGWVPARLNRASVRLGFGDRAGVLEDTNAAMRVNANEPMIYMLRGRLAEESHDWSEAAAEYAHALAVAPAVWSMRANAEEDLRDARAKHVS